MRPRLARALRQRPPVDRRVGEDRPRRRSACSTASSELFDKHTARISTGRAQPLPRTSCARRGSRRAAAGKRLNLLYGTQVSARPPRFRLFVNDPGLITRDYGYWVENQLRERFELEGVPVAIDFVRRS